MKILVIGGTQFVGRHIVDALVAQGDEVTLFHRGRTNPELFDHLEHRLGDRNEDLSALAQGQWDATIDPSAYVPRQVRTLAEALGDRGGRYVHISSVSAYGHLDAPGANEDAAHAVLEDPTTEVVNGETYGGLKALCEAATVESFGPDGAGWVGEAPSIVRPTYVAGPYDHTGRFTWWVERIARGGAVLAPGPKSNPFQVIDVRDLANFVSRLAHGLSSGVFHVAGPKPPFSFAEFLDAVVDEVAPQGTELKWIDAQKLLDAGVGEDDLPLWAALSDDIYASALDPSRAIEAGLVIRPLEETIRDVHTHELLAPTPVRSVVGLSPEREAELLGALG
jgi:2'-hydroxyisoflavone reductase